MDTKEKQVRVRFAPSPTGPLHIGGVRTALYNFLFARIISLRWSTFGENYFSEMVDFFIQVISRR